MADEPGVALSLQQTQVFGGAQDISPEQFRAMLGKGFRLETHVPPDQSAGGAATLLRDEKGNLMLEPEGADPLRLKGAIIDVPKGHEENLTFGFGGQPVLSQGGDALPIVGISIPGGKSFNLFEPLGYDIDELQKGALLNVPPEQQQAIAAKMAAAVDKARSDPSQTQLASVRDMLHPEKATQPNPKRASPTQSEHDIRHSQQEASSALPHPAQGPRLHSQSSPLKAQESHLVAGSPGTPVASSLQRMASPPKYAEKQSVSHQGKAVYTVTSYGAPAQYPMPHHVHTGFQGPAVTHTVMPQYQTSPPPPYAISRPPKINVESELATARAPIVVAPKHLTRESKPRKSKSRKSRGSESRHENNNDKVQRKPSRNSRVTCGADFFNYQELASAALEITTSWFTGGSSAASKQKRPIGRGEEYRVELARQGQEKAERRRLKKIKKQQKRLEAERAINAPPSHFTTHPVATQTSFYFSRGGPDTPHPPAHGLTGPNFAMTPHVRSSLSPISKSPATSVPNLQSHISMREVGTPAPVAAQLPSHVLRQHLPLSQVTTPLSPAPLSSARLPSPDSARPPQEHYSTVSHTMPGDMSIKRLDLADGLGPQGELLSRRDRDVEGEMVFGPRDIAFGPEARTVLRQPVTDVGGTGVSIPTVVEGATILHPQLRLNGESGALEVNPNAVLGLMEQLEVMKNAASPLDEQIQAKIAEHKIKHGDPQVTYTQVKLGENIENQLQHMAVQREEMSDVLDDVSSPSERDEEAGGAAEGGSPAKTLISGPVETRLFQLKSPLGMREVEMVVLSASSPQIQMYRDFCNLEEIEQLQLIIQSIEALPDQPNNLLINSDMPMDSRRLIRRVIGRICALAGIDENSIIAVCPSVVSQTAADSTKEYDAIFRIYLSEQMEGCESEFPFLGVSITPKQGCGVLWQCRNERGIKLARAAHSEKVVAGESRVLFTAYIKH